MASSSRTRAWVLGAFVLATSLTLSVVWTLLIGARSGKVLFESCDPSFCLRVAEGSTSYPLLTAHQHYEVWVTRRGSPDYGYVVDHSFGWHGFDTAATIRASKVEWSESGVSLSEPTGQLLFVPVALYASGR